MLTVFCDQIVIILNRLTVIERIRLDANRLKGGLVKKRGWDNYLRAFGEESFSWRWLIPTSVERTLTVE